MWQRLTTEANIVNLVLPAEQTPGLQEDTAAERTRAVKASRARASATQNKMAALTAAPPVPQLHGAVVHVDAGVALPTDWLLHVSRNEARAVQESDAHHVRFFVAENPWAPTSVTVSWAACLTGAFVVTPAVYMQAAAGPSLKYNPAVRTKRRLWASDAFQAEFPRLWLLILEVMSCALGLSQWKVIPSVEEFDMAKVKAERGGHSAEVVALVSSAEAVVAGKGARHIFDADAFFNFITSVDNSRTTLGLGSV